MQRRAPPLREALVSDLPGSEVQAFPRAGRFSVALDPVERMPRPYFVKGAVSRADHEDPSRCRASAALDPVWWILEPFFVKGAD